jgi:hypothetical protein
LEDDSLNPWPISADSAYQKPLDIHPCRPLLFSPASALFFHHSEISSAIYFETFNQRIYSLEIITRMTDKAKTTNEGFKTALSLCREMESTARHLLQYPAACEGASAEPDDFEVQYSDLYATKVRASSIPQHSVSFP